MNDRAPKADGRDCLLLGGWRIERRIRRGPSKLGVPRIHSSELRTFVNFGNSMLRALTPNSACVRGPRTARTGSVGMASLLSTIKYLVTALLPLGCCFTTM